MITPLRLIIAVSSVLVAAFGIFDRHAQNFLGIRLGDDFWDVDFVARRCGAHAGANNDQNSEAKYCSSHRIPLREARSEARRNRSVTSMFNYERPKNRALSSGI